MLIQPETRTRFLKWGICSSNPPHVCSASDGGLIFTIFRRLLQQQISISSAYKPLTDKTLQRGGVCRQVHLTRHNLPTGSQIMGSDGASVLATWGLGKTPHSSYISGLSTCKKKQKKTTALFANPVLASRGHPDPADISSKHAALSISQTCYLSIKLSRFLSGRRRISWSPRVTLQMTTVNSDCTQAVHKSFDGSSCSGWVDSRQKPGLALCRAAAKGTYGKPCIPPMSSDFDMRRRSVMISLHAGEKSETRRHVCRCPMIRCHRR